jgi:hypothetical protein
VAELDVESLGGEPFGDGLGEVDLVLDHENAHISDSDPPGARGHPRVLREVLSGAAVSAVSQC